MKTKKNGFTLVELIVVLVILAVLAALLVPALTGYIDKARKSQVIAETRQILMATQTTMSEYYATDEWRTLSQNKETSPVDFNKYYLADKNNTSPEKSKRFAEIESLSEVRELKDGGSFGAYVTEDGKVAVLVYQDGKGNVGIYYSDTGEIEAYKESEIPHLDHYYYDISFKNKVRYTTYYLDPSSREVPNYLILKSYILETIK